MVVLVADEDAFAGASHAVEVVVLLEALEAGDHGGVLLGLGFFDAEGVVGQRVEANGLGLVGFEGQWIDGRFGRPQGGRSDGRHVWDGARL